MPPRSTPNLQEHRFPMRPSSSLQPSLGYLITKTPFIVLLARRTNKPKTYASKQSETTQTFTGFFASNISLHQIKGSLCSLNTSRTCAVTIANSLLATSISPLMVSPPRAPNSSVIVSENIFLVFALWQYNLL